MILGIPPVLGGAGSKQEFGFILSTEHSLNSQDTSVAELYGAHAKFPLIVRSDSLPRNLQ